MSAVRLARRPSLAAAALLLDRARVRGSRATARGRSRRRTRSCSRSPPARSPASAAPTQRRPVGSAVKLMTALLTLERADLDDTLPRHRLPAGAGRVADRPAAGRAHERARPAARPARRVRQRRGDDAGRAASRAPSARFVRLMNRRARRARADATRATATRSGSTSRAPTRSARDLVTLATLLRTKPFFRRTVNKDERHARPPATIRARSTTATTSCARSAWVNGVKTGHTRGAGYVLVGSGRQQRHPGRLRRARRRRASAPATPTRSRC